MLLRNHWYSAKKSSNRKVFDWCWNDRSVDAETTVSGTAVSSRSVRRQPEKLSRRWWKVWNEVRPGDWCWQSGVLIDQVCQRRKCRVVPGIVSRYREELCSSVLQSYTVCAPGPAASESWRVRLWCGRSVSDWRSAVPLHSEPTGADALGGQEYQPTCRCRSPAGNAPGQLPASGMWRSR